jgi:hypothetical protein
MNVTDLLGLVALVVKTVDTLRYATAKQINGVVTQVLVWAAGIGGVFAVAQTQWAAHISVGNGSTLARQGAWSLVSIGLALSSGGSVLKDFQSAVDNTNTAQIPPLIRTALGKASSVLATAQAEPAAVATARGDVLAVAKDAGLFGVPAAEPAGGVHPEFGLAPSTPAVPAP